MTYVIAEPCIAWSVLAAGNARFFSVPLPGRSAPLDSPGGATKLGRLGVDTPLVAGQPSRDPSQV